MWEQTDASLCNQAYFWLSGYGAGSPVIAFCWFSPHIWDKRIAAALCSLLRSLDNPFLVELFWLWQDQLGRGAVWVLVPSPPPIKFTHFTKHVIVPELMSDLETVIAHWRQLASYGEPAGAGRATGAIAAQAAATPSCWHRLAEIQGTRC